ncbi:MAG: ribosomal protein S18-alanine N-acetyltransferase [bacterium]
MLEIETEKKVRSGLKIEPMALEHLAEVYAIEVSSYPRPWSLKSFADEVARNEYAHYYVSTIDGKVVGYVGAWVFHGEAHITNIAVAHGYRKRKIGERMLAYLLEQCLRLGAETVYLEVRRNNLAAQRLYSRYLFMSDGVRERYYSDNGEDAIILRVRNFRSEAFMKRFRENVERMKRRVEAPAG